jgi:ribosome biogenesis GTPase A
LFSSSKAVGGNKLIELVKNYSKKDSIKTRVAVGIIGYPNVGKSSLINSLIKRKGASVSNQPGHTR